MQIVHGRFSRGYVLGMRVVGLYGAFNFEIGSKLNDEHEWKGFSDM